MPRPTSSSYQRWRHEEDLIIRYQGVRSVSLGADLADMREVLLDEILPHKDGCTHEIVCLGGSVVITCADLEATWVSTDCGCD